MANETEKILAEKGIKEGQRFSIKGDFDCEHNQSCLMLKEGTLYRMFNVINTPQIEGVYVCGDGLSGLWLMERASPPTQFEKGSRYIFHEVD